MEEVFVHRAAEVHSRRPVVIAPVRQHDLCVLAPVALPPKIVKPGRWLPPGNPLWPWLRYRRQQHDAKRGIAQGYLTEDGKTLTGGDRNVADVGYRA